MGKDIMGINKIQEEINKAQEDLDKPAEKK